MNRLNTCIGLVLILIAPIAGAQTQVDRTLAAAPNSAVSISNVAGSIQVIGWEKSEIRVTGDLDKGVERLDFSILDGRAQIKVVLPKESKNDGAAHLTVYVPANDDIKVDTVSASISVGDAPQDPPKEEVAPDDRSAIAQDTVVLRTVSGKIKLAVQARSVSCHSVSGDIEFTGSTDHFTGETVSGSIQCNGRTGSLTAKTISGNINAKSVGPKADATTVSGRITVEQEGIKKTTLTSVSGDILLQATLADTGHVDANAQSGNVRFDLRNEAQNTFTVRSKTGQIHVTNFGSGYDTPKPEQVPNDISRGRVFIRGNSAGQVHLESGSGNATINQVR